MVTEELKWFPAYLPERIQIVVSCLEGEVKEALETKGTWDSLVVEPLDPKGQRQLLTEYLKRFNKSLPADLLNQALGHPLANNPLWLKTLAEELRLFGSHEELSDRLNTLLGPPKAKDENEPPTVDDLFEHVLQRIEGDQGRKLVRDALTAIWASRAGLSEHELLEILAPLSITTGKTKKANKLPPAQWAPVRNALDEMLLESGGRIIFGHDYVKVAVKDRYLPRESLQLNAHKRLAEHFAKLKVDERVAEELPHQWREAKAWRQLEQTLTSLEMFKSLKAHRSDEEHLGYWLSLEAVKGRQLLEARFKSAWKKWNLPSNKENTADIAGDLVEFFRYAGRGLTGSFAVLLAKKSLDITAKIKGPNHIKTGVRFNTIGGLFQDKGNLEAAEPLYRRALAITEKSKGYEHPETGIRLNNLGTLLHDKGDYENAESLLRRALAITEKALGSEHLNRGIRLSNLGTLLHDKRDYENAERMLKGALKIAEKFLGPKHPITSKFLNNLGSLFQDIGELDQAKLLLIRALEIIEKTLGPEHPHTAIMMDNLGRLLKDKGDYKDAETQIMRALNVFEKTLGPDHPSTATSLNNLGGLHRAKGEFVHAEPLQRRALVIVEKTLGSGHPVTARALKNLGNTLIELGRNVEAIDLLYCELGITNMHDGEKSYSAAETHRRLGVILKYAERHKESKGEFQQALEIFELINTRNSA
jgi:nephrocystin-3